MKQSNIALCYFMVELHYHARLQIAVAVFEIHKTMHLSIEAYAKFSIILTLPYIADSSFKPV